MPIGIISGIYVAEYRGTRLAAVVRFAADTLNGVPSIVIGVFVYGIAVLPFKQFSALAGGRGARDHDDSDHRAHDRGAAAARARARMREGALALGATRARAVFTVVLPAALPGIMTGVVLALARDRRRNGAAALHRLQQPLLQHQPHAADLVADRADLHLRHLALRGLAPPGLGGRARARVNRACSLLAAGAGASNGCTSGASACPCHCRVPVGGASRWRRCSRSNIPDMLAPHALPLGAASDSHSTNDNRP